MKHAMDVIFDFQWVAMGIVVGIALVARVVVFCYWWVRGAWEDERRNKSTGPPRASKRFQGRDPEAPKFGE